MNEKCLIEIGCEELPAKLVLPLIESIVTLTQQCLDKRQLSYQSIEQYATPRRLALIINNINTSTSAKAVKKKGPYLSYAYDEAKQPTAAALGFASSCGVELSALKTMHDAKGERFYFEESIPGELVTEHLLAWFMQDVIQKLQGFKTMRWGQAGNFVRPIQWLVGKLGAQTLKGNIFTVKAGEYSYGHRFMSYGKIKIGHADDYLMLMREHYVEACVQSRSNKIKAQINKILPKNQKAIIDSELLAEVTQLVEWPVAMLGSFKKEFLRLPKAALQAVLKQHQRCFVIEQDGALINNYIMIANLVSKHPEQVIAGNNHVITARLSDACFFYDLDCQKTLSQHSEQLSNMVYQAKLGTMADKVQRLIVLAKDNAKALGVNTDDLMLAARLSKSDLACQLVNELPEIQGKFAQHLALREKIKPEIAFALASYNNNPNDALGLALTIIDQLDHLNQFTSIGLYPTGDKDPFGLRRAATTLLNSSLALGPGFDLKQHISSEKTLSIVTERFYHWCRINSINLTYLTSVEHLFKQGDVQRIAEILIGINSYSDLDKLIACFKRINNITKKLLEPKILELENLTALTLEYELNLIKSLKSYKYGAVAFELSQLNKIAEQVESMLDHVHIMVENIELSQQRQILMFAIKKLFLRISDFSKIS